MKITNNVPIITRIRNCYIHKKYMPSMNLISEWEAKQEFSLNWTNIIRIIQRTPEGFFKEEYVYLVKINESKGEKTRRQKK